MYTDVAYKKIIVVLVISFVALIVAAVLATYFAKTPKNNDENKKFLEYVCQNLSYIKEINDYCKGSTTPEYSSEPAKPIARLPSTLIPSAYELNYNFYAEPNQEPDYFSCDETIYFTCQQPTDTIAIHMKELTIDNSSFILTLVNDSNPYSANQIRTTVTWTYEPDKEFMFIKFGQYSFTPNSSYSLRLVFSAPFRSDSTGLYKTFYTNQQLKSTRWLVILESQPISARRAFVCFDEPTYKAKYKISVIHSSQLVVLSNMPLLDITNGNITILRTRSEFAQSPVISSYQISLVLSDYKCSTQTSVIGPNNSTSISICAPPASITKVEYSLGLSKSLFEFLETNYRVKYSLQKCDFVSLPQETSSYGRSNWGLIKMKDEVLFNDVKTFSQVTLQKNLIQISKQISHQWLSGLTTPKWWDDYWFYESLNSFLAYIAINNVNPGLSIFEQLIIEQFKIMNEDAISPIVIDTQQINRPLEEYFDKMSILKGTSLIKMAAYIIGLDTFSSGVTKMLSSYSYSNAKQADFWSNFNNITSMNGLNLSYIMHFWTNQQGHPILNIKRINSTHLSLTQSQFSINPSLAGSQKWLIPFTYAIVDNTTFRNNDLFNSSLSNLNTNIITISPDLNEMIIQSTKPLTNQSYIIANFDAFAFYRVNYDNQNWDTIIKQLTTLKNNIPARNRAQFINDLFAFSQANLIDPLKPLKLLSYLSSEDEYVAWQAAINQITNLKDLIDSTPIYGLYRTYVLKLVSPIYTTLGWSENINDSSLTRLLRNSILEFACDFEMQDCVEKSMAIFKSWTLNSTLNSVPIAYQRFVYCIGIEYGTVDDWKYTYNQFTLEQDPILKDNLLHGLSCSREPWLIQTYLNYQIDPNFFVSNETLLDAIKYSSSTSYSYLLTWQFVKKNWNSIYSRLLKKPSAFDRFIQHLTRKFNSQDLLNDLSQFFQDKQQLSSKLQTTQNRILMNLKWLSNIYDPLTKWLTNQ